MLQRGTYLIEKTAAEFLRAAGVNAAKILPGLKMHKVGGNPMRYAYLIDDLRRAAVKEGCQKLPDLNLFLTRWQKYCLAKRSSDSIDSIRH